MSFLIGNIIDVLCEKEDSDDIIEILNKLRCISGVTGSSGW